MNIAFPDNYAMVIFAVGPATFLATQFMGGPVMKARKRLNVPYPNLYATPGHHKHADEFNRVQRGAQSIFESLSPMQAMTVFGGLVYPRFAAAGYLTYLAGSFLYAKGYANMNHDVKNARYKDGGFLKPLGMVAVFGAACATCWGMM